MSVEVKYPDAHVQLSGEDGNAFAIIAKASRALSRAGASEEECTQFRTEAMSGDYDHLLSVVMQWMEVS